MDFVFCQHVGAFAEDFDVGGGGLFYEGCGFVEAGLVLVGYGDFCAAFACEGDGCCLADA